MTRDLFRALRWLTANPLFALAVTSILALGIGANTAVFGIVDAVLLRPLPYHAPDRLVRIEESDPKRPVLINPAQDYFRWSGRADLFERTVPYVKDNVTLTGAGDPDQIFALRTSAALFTLLGVPARLGRPLVDSDDDARSQKAAVLSDRFWRRRFHADPGVIGRTINVSDELVTIVGVMPPEFEFPSPEVEMWTPLRLSPSATNSVQVVARLKTGIAIAQVQGAMDIVARQLAQEDPQRKGGIKLLVSPWRESTARQYELTMVFILAAVGLFLLIACADVGSLLLSRAVQRQREIAIRLSLGAGPWRVLRQLLAEGLTLAVLGSAAGILVAFALLRFLREQLTALPISLPHIHNVALDGRVLAFSTVLCLVLAGVCSLAPVLLVSKLDPETALRGGRGAAGSRRSGRIFAILIASEAAFAFLLLVGSGLMIRSLIRLQEADHGLRPDHVLTLRVPIGTLTQSRPGGKYATKPRQMAYYRDLVERLQRIPGVKEVGFVNNLPLSEANTSTVLNGPDGAPILNSTRTISPGYFSAMGIPLIAGRIFTDADQRDAPGVAIVNQYLARQLFAGVNPIGQTLPAQDSAKPITIVGVVKDTPQRSYDQPAQGEVYSPYQQFIFGTFLSTIVVRSSSEPLSVAPALRKEIWAVDASQPVLKVATMNDVIASSIWRPRFSAWVLTVLGGLALLLTCAGVYGVVAYTATLRARELAIRVAVGASPGRVVATILRGSMVPLAAGLALSLIASLLLTRLLASLLFEIRTTDPSTYAGAAAVLLTIGVVASVRPAWRAAVSDPVVVLRAE